MKIKILGLIVACAISTSVMAVEPELSKCTTNPDNFWMYTLDKEGHCKNITQNCISNDSWYRLGDQKEGAKGKALTCRLQTHTHNAIAVWE
jgi:hypothetical protein